MACHAVCLAILASPAPLMLRFLFTHCHCSGQEKFGFRVLAAYQGPIVRALVSKPQRR